MADTELTTVQKNQLTLLSSLNYDTAALKEAKEFIQDDPFKHQLFLQQYNRVFSESDNVARTIKAVQESVEALAVIEGKATAE